MPFVRSFVEIVGMHAAEEVQGRWQATPRQREGHRQCIGARSTRVQFARCDELRKSRCRIFRIAARIAQPAIAQGRLVKGFGCRTCNGTGYKGRVALYEVMRFTDNLKEMVLQGSSTAELKMAAIKAGMTSLRMSGILKVLDGVTTTEEILRVTMAD